jgi:ribosomal protein L35
MPKMKTHSGTKKRITKITKNGKIKRSHAYRSHILNKMSTKRKRQLRKAGYVDASNAKNIKVLLPYK